MPAFEIEFSNDGVAWWAAVGAPSSLLGDGAAAPETGGGSRLWWPWPSLAAVVGIGALVIGLAGRAVKGRGAEMV